MKKYIIIAALAATTTTAFANTEYTNIEANDTVVVIDNSADDEIIGEFVKTNDEFDLKSRKHATYEDGTKVFAGNSSVPVELDARPQRSWYIGLGGSLVGTMGSNYLWGPKGSILGGYEGNHWGAHASLGLMQIKPNEQSDFQGRVKALEVSMGLTRSLKQWNDHHTRLDWYGDAVFRTAYDRQDLGTYENVSVEETETEIVTTTEKGWRAYIVNPFMFGADTGLIFSHQFYKLPLALFAKTGVGFTSQIAGKESVNGSADGIGYKPTFRFEVGVRFYLTAKSKNVKAQNMIRH